MVVPKTGPVVCEVHNGTSTITVLTLVPLMVSVVAFQADVIVIKGIGLSTTRIGSLVVTPPVVWTLIVVNVRVNLPLQGMGVVSI